MSDQEKQKNNFSQTSSGVSSEEVGSFVVDIPNERENPEIMEDQDNLNNPEEVEEPGETPKNEAIENSREVELWSENLTFEVSEITGDKFPKQYCFFLDDNGFPTKIGDGTFGAVYKVFDRKGEGFALKVLYESKTFEKFLLDTDNFEKIISDFKDKFDLKDDELPEILKDFSGVKDSKVALDVFLARLESSLQDDTKNDEYFSFIIKRIFEKNIHNEPIAVERFLDEIKVAKKIIAGQISGNQNNPFVGVVRVIDGTRKFKSSSAYESLESKFLDTGFTLSNYAVVMNLYSCTLKDILENETERYSIQYTPEIIRLLYPESSSVGLMNIICDSQEEVLEKIKKSFKGESFPEDIIRKNIYNLTGYDILKSMRYRERIGTILPYLIGVAKGIKTLHASGLLHLDIKPANIFVNDDPKNLEVVIGDFGFLETSEEQTAKTKYQSIRDSLPLGTLHYRSPEQKDYFDVCNVEIKEIASEKSLIISDPKFKDSLIEKEDYLVFSKDLDFRPCTIKSIDNFEDENSHSFKKIIKISIEPDHEILEEKATQVNFYKRQTVKTDLFGIGALAFDLLTGGKSPERFYENIRSEDFQGKGKGINQLMQAYQAVISSQSTEPRLIHLFEPFKDDKFLDYAPPEIVRLILKCMFCKADGTFFQEALVEANANDLIAKEKISPIFAQNVRQYLQDKNGLADNYKIYNDDNPLITQKLEEDSQPSPQSLFSSKINDLQNTPPQDLIFRLARAICYLDNLVNFVRYKILDPKSDVAIFIAEMRPENIILKENENIAFNSDYSIIYKTQNDYLMDLKNDSVCARIRCDSSEPYVPDYVAYMRRPIILKALNLDQKELNLDQKELNQEQDREAKAFQFKFTDSSPLGSRVFEGDWVVVNNSLFNILTVTDDIIKIKIKDGDDSTLKTLDEDTPYIYYRSIDPCRYYLNMLAIFLYQLFFVGLGKAKMDKPLIISNIQGRILMDRQPRIYQRFHKSSEGISKFDLDLLFQFIAYIYLKLRFLDDKASYYFCHGDSEDFSENEEERKTRADFNRLGALEEDIEKMKKIFHELTGHPANSIKDFLDPKFVEKKKRKKEYDQIVSRFLTTARGDRPDGQIQSNLEFENLINSLIIEGSWGSIWKHLTRPIG